jgi:hypothetical protein
LWSDDIPYEQRVISLARRILRNDRDPSALVDAGENLATRSLRFSLTADEEHTGNGESTRKNARIGHNFPRIIWTLASPASATLMPSRTLFLV